MPSSLPDERAHWDLGCRMACEGILRSRFGRRQSEVAKKAIAQLRSGRVIAPHDSNGTANPSSENKVVKVPSRQWKATGLLLALAASIIVLLGWRFLLPPTGVPIISSLQGGGAILERGDQHTPLSLGTVLRAGDILRLPEGALATISFPPESTQIQVAQFTELIVNSFANSKLFFLRSGTLEASVAHQGPFRPMRIRTVQAEARVLGTKLTLTASTDSTTLAVEQGKVRFTSLETGSFVDVSSKYHATVGRKVELAALPQTGEIVREYWTNISGPHLVRLTSNPRFPLHPDGWERLARFEVAPKGMTNFGDRIRAYLQPPATGRYRFFISGADDAMLFLSPDVDPDHRVSIGYSDQGLASDDWNAQHSQQDLILTAGKRYYIEALRKCGTGSDHLRVGWQPPGGERESIPAQFLSPYESKQK